MIAGIILIALAIGALVAICTYALTHSVLLTLGAYAIAGGVMIMVLAGAIYFGHLARERARMKEEAI